MVLYPAGGPGRANAAVVEAQGFPLDRAGFRLETDRYAESSARSTRWDHPSVGPDRLPRMDLVVAICIGLGVIQERNAADDLARSAAPEDIIHVRVARPPDSRQALRPSDDVLRRNGRKTGTIMRNETVAAKI